MRCTVRGDNSDPYEGKKYIYQVDWPAQDQATTVIGESMDLDEEPEIVSRADGVRPGEGVIIADVHLDIVDNGVYENMIHGRP